ncbi:vitellogenin receptor-like [Daphnia pulex]|uniref:vitellogenin receptor-like n=1 Tax=Daphnia pulex TaxID=6669 RepID=UPI001EDF6834|nr:vitellogenin receptor-like [Daphnia pulex]
MCSTHWFCWHGWIAADKQNQKDIIWPNRLVVDETIQRIYWGDAKLNRIESSRIDGSDRNILPVKVTHQYTLNIFENNIFWCDPLEHEVLSVNKFTGKDYKILIKEASLTPTGIHVHHPSKQSHLTDPCRNVICNHLCLLSSTVQGYNCACPVGMTLNKDVRTCEFISAHDSSIVIATFTYIYRLTHHQIGKDTILRLPTRNMENIGPPLM